MPTKTPGGSGASEKFLKQQAESESSSFPLTATNTLLIAPALHQSTAKAHPTPPATRREKRRAKLPYVSIYITYITLHFYPEKRVYRVSWRQGPAQQHTVHVDLTDRERERERENGC